MRSLTHVDLPVRSTLNTGVSLFRNQTNCSFTISRRAFQSTSATWNQAADETDIGRGAHDTETAIADLSLESIDAILAESVEEPVQEPVQRPMREPTTKLENFEPPVQTLRKARHENGRNGKGKHGRDIELAAKLHGQGQVVRRTRVENTGLAIHYSNPIASPKSSKDRNQDAKHETTKGSKYINDDWEPPTKEEWMVQKAALKEKFPDGWNPRKRLSPDAMAGIRALNAQFPDKYTTPVLADHFKVPAEAIRRILRSKWTPRPEESVDRDMRWFKRGEKVWSRQAELGLKPPSKWRALGIGRGKPEWKKPREEKVVPALLTTSRRPGGYFGEPKEDVDADANAGKGLKGVPLRDRPELVTVARPPGDFKHF